MRLRGIRAGGEIVERHSGYDQRRGFRHQGLRRRLLGFGVGVHHQHADDCWATESWEDFGVVSLLDVSEEFGNRLEVKVQLATVAVTMAAVMETVLWKVRR